MLMISEKHQHTWIQIVILEEKEDPLHLKKEIIHYILNIWTHAVLHLLCFCSNAITATVQEDCTTNPAPPCRYYVPDQLTNEPLHKAEVN